MNNLFYFIPGFTQLDDVTVYNANGEKIGYKQLKNDLGSGFKFINFNYPNLLIRKKILTAQIISFYRNKVDYFARTAIVGRDDLGRHLPITEIMINNDNLTIKEITKLSDNDFSNKLHFPKFPHLEIKNPTKPKMQLLKDLKKIIDWNIELKDSLNRILNIYDNKLTDSGINICFNAETKKKYSSFIYYSLSNYKKKKILILGILILFTCLIVLLMKYLKLFSFIN